MTFAGSLAGLLLEVIGFPLEEPAGLTLEKLKTCLLGAEKDLLKLDLLAVVILKLSLESVRWK